MKLAVLLALLLATAALSAPYSWEPKFAPPAFRAPTDQTVRDAKGALRVRGASLQGGLVDLRYGQVSVDLGGVSEVLETDERSKLTLNATAVTPEELLKRVPEGLAVAVRYHPDSGKVGWLDAFSGGDTSLPAVQLQVSPWKGPAYRPGEVLTISMPPQEARRVGAGSFHANIPGVAQALPFLPTQGGGYKTFLRVLPGWDYVHLPVFVTRTRGKTRAVFRGPRLSFSSSPPEITSFGPQRASVLLPTVSGWVDTRSPSRLLDPTTAKLSVSSGARVVKFQPRVDRTVFEIAVDGPGEYWLEFSIADRLGRRAIRRWPLTVLTS